MLAWLSARYGPEVAARIAKIVFWLIVAVVVIAVLGIAKCSYDQRAKTEIKLETNRAGAGIASGKAAVDITGNRQTAEEAGAVNVQEDQHAINNATDAGAVTDAALAGLHRVRGQNNSSGRAAVH